MDIGLLILRSFVGVAFVMHGTQKLFGWFGGFGPAGTSGFMGSLGYRNPRFAALGAGIVETAAGLMLVTGFLAPLAAAGIVGMMLNAAISVNREKGFIGGYELDAVYGVAAAAIAFTGAGRYALDAALGWDPGGTVWGVIAVVAGLAVGTLVLASRRTAAVSHAADERHAERRAA